MMADAINGKTKNCMIFADWSRSLRECVGWSAHIFALNEIRIDERWKVNITWSAMSRSPSQWTKLYVICFHRSHRWWQIATWQRHRWKSTFRISVKFKFEIALRANLWLFHSARRYWRVLRTKPSRSTTLMTFAVWLCDAGCCCFNKWWLTERARTHSLAHNH